MYRFGVNMGKTTVFIDNMLLEKAIKAVKAKSKKEAIEKKP